MSDPRRDDQRRNDRYRDVRERMVARQLAARDITDTRVLHAMRRVPRHEYVPASLAEDAYADGPLPIGLGVTISQPYIVALMTQALAIEPTDRVLEVGTGSGYGAAVLAEIAEHVTTVESLAAHASTARERLARYGDRVRVVEGDGSNGYPPDAPYDAISVTAAAPEIPRPLLEQLATGGRLVIPVGSGVEDLVRITRTPDGDVREVITQVRFVPLIGEHGVGHR
jgi:protein-L-isoaspartate(D-aspartate) O-methyltransferase